MSVDQLESSSPSLIAQLKDKLTQQRYKYAMVFIDQFSGNTFIYLQKHLTSKETIQAKHADRISTKKEPCLTPTLMDEGQARNPNTTYNGYKMEFWKFALTWKLICPVQHKITQKEQTETTKKGGKRNNKKGGISLTIMDQKSIYNSIHKPRRSTNEMLGFNQVDHPYRMCNETGITEFLELQIPGIPMVVKVTSRAHSLCDPT